VVPDSCERDGRSIILPTCGSSRSDPLFGVIDYERWGELWMCREAARRR